MKRFLSILFAFFLLFPLFSETVLVLDFDTEIKEYENNAVIMSDMLRSELVKTGKFDVIDKKSMGAAIKEIQGQMSDYMTNDNVKQLGRMLNADYLVIGHVLTLSNSSPETRDSENIFLNTAEKILIGKDKIEVIVQILEIETLKVLSSSSVELKKWTDFSKYTKKIARELTADISQKNSSFEKIITNINKTSEEMFEGVWTAEVVHDGVTDVYTISFNEKRKIDISVTSSSKNGKETKSNGTGRYAFNDSEKILSITVNLLKGNIKHLKSINWKSFVNPSNDGQMFSYSIPVSSSNNAKNIRAEFYKE